MSNAVGAAAEPKWMTAVERACARIAPTWPLDQFIAVNPYWGRLDQPIRDAAAELATLSGSRLTLPRSYYREQWRARAFDTASLQAAIDEAGAPVRVDPLISALDADPAARQPLPLVSDAADAHRDLRHVMPWRDFVTHQVSQHAAAFFDRHQAAWGLDRSGGLYASWRRQALADRGTATLMGRAGLPAFAASLPEGSRDAVDRLLGTLGSRGRWAESYLGAVLLSINGWASWCAYERWQDGLKGSPTTLDGHLFDLLAIRLAWEAFLFDAELEPSHRSAWAAAWAEVAAIVALERVGQANDWLYQRAMELAYASRLCAELSAGSRDTDPTAPQIQAVFCIDVRSEVFRRALEAEGPRVQTLGFAGFFGLPIAYSPIASAMTRPQLPGLLAPALGSTDEAAAPSLGDAIRRRRTQALGRWQRWKDFRGAAASTFTFVESIGLAYAGALLGDSLPHRGARRPVEQIGLSAAEVGSIAPMLQPNAPADSPAWLDAQCELAAGVVRAMSLPRPHARLVLLAGHGSQSANNPHAGGLDCGACGGQTGEVNARILAGLLNDPEIRRGLRERSVAIDNATCFVAGLHNTTTDDVTLFDLAAMPETHAADLAALQKMLGRAGERARIERAPGLDGVDPRGGLDTHSRIRERANDWAQVRPEWGLANNAAFIVAPRSRSRHIDLQGRSFLHDYRWQDDDGYSVLELILTAPMVVTNWINLQYYASTVDNSRYGSGNKVLHNVVGGRLGVFEGNGGDLRIGLPWQSLHDGAALRHTPLRLSVFVEAPQGAIESIVAKHETVERLIQNEWIHFYRLADDGSSYLLRGSSWRKTANRSFAMGELESVPARDAELHQR